MRPRRSGDLGADRYAVSLPSLVQALPLPGHCRAGLGGTHPPPSCRRRDTALAFDTEQAERPQDDWVCDDQRPVSPCAGPPVVEALRRPPSPTSRAVYSFSCYRATEYVTVLGIARSCRPQPQLAARLQRQWETRAVMSGLFHDVPAREYGSLQDPLPPRYYVPGDRLWFRNPDEHSVQRRRLRRVVGVLLGSGTVQHFWKRDQPYTLAGKCVEIYHWRYGARRNEAGELIIDQSIVERVHATMADPQATARVLSERMVRIRDPQGIYAEGGCIDATRECALGRAGAYRHRAARLPRPALTQRTLPSFQACSSFSYAMVWPWGLSLPASSMARAGPTATWPDRPWGSAWARTAPCRRAPAAPAPDPFRWPACPWPAAASSRP